MPATITAFGGSALGLLGFAALLLRGNLVWLVIGEDNRYSNSKFQMALWFWVVLSAYLAAVVLRIVGYGLQYAGGIDMPISVLGLSGMSALTFAGAKQIVVSRLDQQGGNARGVKAHPLGGPRFPTDLVTDDSGHRPDFGDFQMLVITLVAVGVWSARVIHWLGGLTDAPTVSLPDVDGTILGTFGVGQGAYLAKKFAGETPPAAPGPVRPATRGGPPRPIEGRVLDSREEGADK